MNYLNLAKQAIKLVVGVGVSKIVNDIIENNVEAEKAHHKVAVPVASTVVGLMAADASSDYIDYAIDEIAEWWTENVTNRNQKKPELKIVTHDED